jgi:hypothetical protein
MSSRQQIIGHLRENSQRTDPQKIEIQQRRNVLTRRIKAWRVAQAVYMPQTLTYFADESGSSAFNDIGRLDDSKPETWPLFLPSSIPKDDRPSCYKGVIETEQVLRLAQLQDSLVDLRRFRRTLRNLRLYFKKNTAGEGQKTQTKSRAVEAGVNSRIKRAVSRYRIAYRALLELDPTGEWMKEFRELKDEDNRGPLKELEERGVGDGRYAPSWIWAVPSLTPLDEGSVAEEGEVNETVRHEWMTCRARADRWVEEEELLREEMRRVIVYLEWKSRSWSDKVGTRADSCPPDIRRGLDAYARKQANIYRGLMVSFASQWLPYLKACGLDTKWATKFSWISPILSRETKLPMRFSNISTDPPNATPAIGSSPSSGVLGAKQGPQVHQDSSETQNDGSGYRGTEENDSGDQEDDSDDEEESDEDGNSSDDVAGDNEFGFEFDDEYMA